MNKRVRTRMAPSPTGRLHIGSVQKILYSYACAAKFGGDYILRIEDTDRTRFVESAEQEIYEVHDLLGIKISESPREEGAYGPYRQSERLEIYQKYAQQLVAEGKAFYAFETAEELEAMRNAAQAAHKNFRYRDARQLVSAEDAAARIAAGDKYVVRLKVPETGEVSYQDIILGEVKFQFADLDEYVLLKSDGFPTYHLAVVIDDHLMEISHIFRGVEWIATSPVHIMLYQYFGWDVPQIAHIPNLLDPNGGKLSKRSGSVAALDFFRDGYLPAAVINYMMLQSWNPKTEQEIFTLAEFVEQFDLAKFNKSNPVFSRQKLDWFNEQHIRALSTAELLAMFQKWWQRFGTEFADADAESMERFLAAPEALQLSILGLEQERLRLLADLLPRLDIYFAVPTSFEFDHKQVRKLTTEQLQMVFKRYAGLLSGDWAGEWVSHETWEQAVRGLATELELPAGSVFMSIRVALTGRSATPPLYEIASLLGAPAQLARVEAALQALPA